MIVRSVQLALQMIKKNTFRTSLTVFGITIGIMMVILVLSAGAGVKSMVLGQLQGWGDDWINIEVKVPSAGKMSRENAQALARGVTITTLTYDDAKRIIALPNIDTAYAGITTQAVLSYKTEKDQPTLFAVTASYPDVDDSKTEYGRFFTQEEERAAAQVIVLGSEIAEQFFGNEDAVGRYIKVDTRNFLVVGVMEERGVTGFLNMDEIAFIPLRTAQKKIMGIDHVLWILGKTVDNSTSETTAEEIRAIMREQHDITDPERDDFAVTTMTESIEVIGTVLNAITWLLVALAAISLLVGGVGIMNVMYVSVAERTFEIGLRKAVGASKAHILWQFLIEAIIITLFGGAIGIIFGSGVAFLIAVAAQYMGFDWVYSVSLFSIVLGVGFSAAVGLLFGLYPAKQAASLDPVEAMRKE